MTNVLKNLSDQSVDHIRRVEWRPPTDNLAQPSPTDIERARLEDEISRLKEDLEALRADAIERCAIAREEGRQEAEADFKRDDAARLAALEAGVTQAVTAAKNSFSELDRLAIRIAETALANAFDDAGAYREQIAGAIRHQVTALGANAILKVCVSAADFADEAALQTLGHDIRQSGLLIEASDGVASGCARIALHLGEVELNLPQYWQDVKTLLATFADAAKPKGLETHA